METIKLYFSLTKPGMVLGNVITVLGGFFLASHRDVDYLLLFFTVLGIALVMAGSCVVNNYIDRDIDKLMERTKERALARGALPLRPALAFGSLLTLFGFGILFFYTNTLAFGIAALGFFFYVVMYSLFFKRRSTLGTFVGSISGAVPPVVGYTAVSNSFDAGALILFLMLVLWQMPHFFSIAIYRLSDYTAASIPVLPVKRGLFITKIETLLYVSVFVPVSLSLWFIGYAGNLYLFTAAILGGMWLGLSILGFKSKNEKMWARWMFFFSLILITALSLMMAVDAA